MEPAPAPLVLGQLPQYIAQRDVRRALGNAAYSTINAMIEEGQLPRPIRPRKNLVLFPRDATLAAFKRLGAAA